MAQNEKKSDLIGVLVEKFESFDSNLNEIVEKEIKLILMGGQLEDEGPDEVEPI